MEHLSEQQREQWAIDGYLHLEGQLGPDEVAFFSEELDRIRLQPGCGAGQEPAWSLRVDRPLPRHRP